MNANGKKIFVGTYEECYLSMALDVLNELKEDYKTDFVKRFIQNNGSERIEGLDWGVYKDVGEAYISFDGNSNDGLTEWKIFDV